MLLWELWHTVAHCGCIQRLSPTIYFNGGHGYSVVYCPTWHVSGHFGDGGVTAALARIVDAVSAALMVAWRKLSYAKVDADMACHMWISQSVLTIADGGYLVFARICHADVVKLMFGFVFTGDVSPFSSDMVLRVRRHFHFCDYRKTKRHIREKLQCKSHMQSRMYNLWFLALWILK